MSLPIPVSASTGPEMYVSPSTLNFNTTTPLGHKFNVTGYIANITSDRPAFTWQVQMFWDLTQLNVTRARYTGTAGVMSEFFEGHITTSPGASINYATGYVLIAETLMGTDTAYTGEGVAKSLFWVEFEIIAAPSSPGVFSSTIDISTAYDTKTWVKDADLAKIPLEVFDADYTYTYPFPTIKVEPSSFTASHRGETFDINVTLSDIFANQNLIGPQFRLHYNTSFLHVLNVTEGPFMEQFPNAEPPTYFTQYVEYDYVIVGILLVPNATGEWNTFPEGSGTLATITFEVIKAPPAACSLYMDRMRLVDSESEDIPFEYCDGSYSFNLETMIHTITPTIEPPQTFYVVTVSDIAVNDGYPVPPLRFNITHKMLYFNVTAAEGTTGFVNITIPTALLYAGNDDWLILVGGNLVIPTVVPLNSTHTLLSFSMSLSTKSVYIIGTEVIPEFPTVIIPMIFLTLTLFMAALVKFTRLKKRETYQPKPNNNYYK